MSEWRSVKDETPLFEVRAGSDSFVFVIASGAAGVGEYMFSKHSGWQKVGLPHIESLEVTHWMPLPEPPSEG